METQFNRARKAFFADIGKNRALALDLWREAYAAVLEQKRREKASR